VWGSLTDEPGKLPFGHCKGGPGAKCRHLVDIDPGLATQFGVVSHAPVELRQDRAAAIPVDAQSLKWIDLLALSEADIEKPKGNSSDLIDSHDSVYSGNLPALVIVDGSSDSVEVDRTTSYEILTPDQIMQRLSAIRGSIPTAQ
jgi:hypothetical protein